MSPFFISSFLFYQKTFRTGPEKFRFKAATGNASMEGRVKIG